MKRQFLLSSALLLSAIPTLARAETISNFNAVLTSSNPTELGRPSRNGNPQTWNNTESFPGFINTTTAYNYTTYTFSSSLFTGAPYVEISDYDVHDSTSDFLSAYAGSYNPLSPSTNWLGDEGQSPNYFGTDATYFDVVLPLGQNLVLVFNDTAAAGLNDTHNIEVDAYADTGYDDPAPVTPPPTTVTPEPSSLITLGTGLISVLGIARRRLRKA